MSKTLLDADEIMAHASPLVHQKAHEIQPYGHLVRMPIALAESACKESVDNLNQLLADTMTLRDLYKKHHWQVSGPTFYQLHLLFDKHSRASRASWSMRSPSASSCWAASASPWRRDVAETTLIPAPAQEAAKRCRCRSRACSHAHEIVLEEARTMAQRAAKHGDDGTNDLLVSDVIRTNELQVWFVAEHVVDTPVVHANE